MYTSYIYYYKVFAKCYINALTLFSLCFYRAKNSTFILSTAPTTHGKAANCVCVYVWDTQLIQCSSLFSRIHLFIVLLSRPDLTSTYCLPSISHSSIVCPSVHYLFSPPWQADTLYRSHLSRSQGVYRLLCLRVSLPPSPPPPCSLFSPFFYSQLIDRVTAHSLTDEVLYLSPYHT